MPRLNEKPVSAARAVATAAIGSLLLVLLIWGIHRNSPRTLVSFHGFLHAAITQQFVDGVPRGASWISSWGAPENRFYAGRPLPYYWFFHYVAAFPARALELNPFVALEGVVLLAAVALVCGAVAIGVKLYRSVAGGVMIAFLILAGTNPLGFVFAAIKLAREPQQWHNSDKLWGVAHPLYSLMRFNDDGGLYGPLMNFFLNTTSRPVALAGMLLTLLSLERAVHARGILAWVGLFVSAAITTAMSPALGLAASGALVVGLAIAGSRTMSRLEATGTANTGASPVAPLLAPAGELATWSIQRTLLAGGVIVLGSLVAWPTYSHLIFGPSASKAEFWLFSRPGLEHVATVALSAAPLMALAFLGRAAMPPNRRRLLSAVLIAAALLIGADLAFKLPAANQSNCFHAAVVLLAVVAAGATVLRNGDELPSMRYARIPVVVAVCLPTLLALLGSYLNRPPIPASFTLAGLARSMEDPVGRLSDWLVHNTPRNAVLVIDPAEFPPMCGNASELPVLTRRALLTEDPRHYLVEPFPDSPQRQEIARRLLTGQALAEADQRYLSLLKRPLYIIRRPSMAQLETVKRALGQSVFEDDRIVVVAAANGLP
ncbi:MAG: DUF2298 domain-containing protein [Phycisphaerae bacterium]